MTFRKVTPTLCANICRRHLSLSRRTELPTRWSDTPKRVGVIGGGPSGLAAIRHCRDAGLNVLCFEQSASLGGTWVYSRKCGVDEFGVPYHSNIYENLKTNLPKEVMNYPDFSYKIQSKSYLVADEVLDYLQDYATTFNVIPHIQFRRKVSRVSSNEDGSWKVCVEDVVDKQIHEHQFDGVMVCSGVDITPAYGNLDTSKFTGFQMHSKQFRVAEPFTGKRILVIGVGPSGLDISHMACNLAKKVFLSHNLEKFILNVSKNIIVKPTISSVEGNTVKFSDNSTEEVDCIVHCTGYKYDYGFLDESCQITVEDYVHPLYQHFININKPSLCFIGLPKFFSPLYIVDYQVRTYINSMIGKIKLPSKEEMMKWYEKDISARRGKGKAEGTFHMLSRDGIPKYFEELARLGGLEPLPPVQLNLFNTAFMRGIESYETFRNDIYKIVDERNFVHTIP